jgi:hypothetical protein
MRMRFILLGLLCAFAAPLSAQTPVITSDDLFLKVISGDGWEAFPNVEYQGGDARFNKKTVGILVMTDSSVAFYECAFKTARIDLPCGSHRTKTMIKEPALWLVTLKAITEVNSSTQVRPASTGEKFMIGILASDRAEEFFGFAHETASSAEAPIFKTQKTQASALEAKLRFRLKKAGVVLETTDLTSLARCCLRTKLSEASLGTFSK